ncbi:hypothetical protein KFL_015640010, partial [Klebsormidium nitens]
MGGNAKIEWDEKKKRRVKHSFKDRTARFFTSKFDADGRQVGELWKKLMDAENDTDRVRRKRKEAVWEAYEALAPYLRDQKYSAATGSDPAKYKQVVHAFLKAFVAAYGETHVTHYMHIIHAHGDYFIQKYGSLARWNTQ